LAAGEFIQTSVLWRKKILVLVTVVKKVLEMIQYKKKGGYDYLISTRQTVNV
jgi:hypothetical protein